MTRTRDSARAASVLVGDMMKGLIMGVGLVLLIAGIAATYVLRDGSPWISLTGFMALCGLLIFMYPGMMVALRKWR